jgi:hypothetical protein
MGALTIIILKIYILYTSSNKVGIHLNIDINYSHQIISINQS